MLLSVFALAAGLLAGCTGEDVEQPAPTTTPLAEVDLTGVSVPRASFCGDLDETSLTEVLGGAPDRTDTWSSGDRVKLSPGTTDVVHEHGCSYGRGPVTARAWVFAQPVTPASARRWVQELRSSPRCERGGPLGFGSPGAVVTCADRRDTTVRMAGLFGESYLTCEVARRSGRSTADDSPELAASERAEQAQRWCADVALSATS
jgi:hypothetical protein